MNPATRWNGFTIEKGRRKRKRFLLYQADGVTGSALGETDVLRFKLWDDSNPILVDVDSVAANANGSQITVESRNAPASVLVTLSPTDTASLAAGATLKGELSIVYAGDGTPIETIMRGEVLIEDSPTGEEGTE